MKNVIVSLSDTKFVEDAIVYFFGSKTIRPIRKLWRTEHGVFVLDLDNRYSSFAGTLGFVPNPGMKTEKAVRIAINTLPIRAINRSLTACGADFRISR
jgi:hypothetical protein